MSASSSSSANQQQPVDSASMDQHRKLSPAVPNVQSSVSRASPAAANGGRHKKFANPVKHAANQGNNSHRNVGGAAGPPQGSGRRGGTGAQGRYGANNCDTSAYNAKQVTSVGALAARPLNSKKDLRYERYEYHEADINNSHNNNNTANFRGSTKYMRNRPTGNNFGGRHRQNSHSTTVFSKEQYLQSNCQFVVNSAGNYDAMLVDPDVPVEWDHIEELRMPTTEAQTCPICLYPPIAAKITRCGHVYCWPCVLHYLSLSDHAWRKCPICYESVYAEHLKSFLSLPVTSATVTGELSLTLMCRQRGSVIIRPADQVDLLESRHGAYSIDGDLGFSKLLLASAADIESGVLNREREQLKWKLMEEQGQPESVFIVAALDALKTRLVALNERREVEAVIETRKKTSGTASPTSEPHLDGESEPIVESGEARAAAICYADAFDEVLDEQPTEKIEARAADEELESPASADEETTLCQTLEDAARVSRKVADSHRTSDSSSGGSHNGNAKTQSQQQHTYFFYQGSDGQQVYLHPLNARCLIEEYGSLEQAPLNLQGSVLQLEQLVMTQQLRQKFRYLTHLPIGTWFTLAEIRFADGVLSPKVQAAFAAEFARRATMRVRRDQSETRRANRAEKLDRAMLMDPANYPKYYAQKEKLEPEDFPEIRFVGSAQRELQAEWTGDPVAIQMERDKASVWSKPQQPPQPEQATSPDQPPPVDLHNTPSFAQMLRQGKPKPGTAPAAGNKPAWGATGTAGGVTPSYASTGGAASATDDGEPSLPAPSLADAWGQAWDSAFSALSNKDQPAATDTTVVPEPSKGKKNKKKKQVVLFST